MDGRLFVILDQLEELFRYHEGEEGESTLAVDLRWPSTGVTCV